VHRRLFGISAARTAKAKILAQRYAVVMLAEEFPSLKFRNHEFDEVVERAG
jgi:hypothetical protein